MYTSKLVPLLTLINIVFASQCPSLTYVEYSGVKAIAALNRPYIADTLTRHDLNVQGINQTFPPGTFVIDSRDNSQLTIFEDECLVLSSWGGYRDAARSLPINNDTKISSFSLGKIPISLGLIWLHDQESMLYLYFIWFYDFYQDFNTINQCLYIGLPMETLERHFLL